ncbi:hypothetical protein A4D02_21315 [Niastella koreensis]|uniref:Uncharacterized protein n=1 Tax=Niastella koreensis TaxID=354356 RepID=A0ABX3P1L5_9BACT|nr:hypothetical protein A4D02_21315 [Niastella koreensis]
MIVTTIPGYYNYSKSSSRTLPKKAMNTDIGITSALQSCTFAPPMIKCYSGAASSLSVIKVESVNILEIQPGNTFQHY